MATHVKVADLNIADDGFGTNIIALTGSNAAVFEIFGKSLYLKAGTVLNASVDFDVTVDVSDSLLSNLHVTYSHHLDVVL